MLRAKAVLCAGLTVRLTDAATGEKDEWHYEDGLRDYVRTMLAGNDYLPADLYMGSLKRDSGAVDFALAWVPDGELVQESYVNLIPTVQGGTHVNGLRSGLTEALREFCDIRSLLPRGVKLAPEDVWDRLSFVLSLKLQDPQFSGQTRSACLRAMRLDLWRMRHTTASPCSSTSTSNSANASRRSRSSARRCG